MRRKEPKRVFLFFIFLVVTVCILPMTCAAPPFEYIYGQNTYTVEGLIQTAVKQNQEFQFTIHLFNSTNGVPVTALAGKDAITCYLHFYDRQGRHIGEAFDETHSHIFDFEFLLNANNFTELGEHKYVVQCNSSAQGGFYASEIYVTKSGHLINEGEATQQGFYAIALLIISGLLMFFALQTEAQGIKLFLLLIGFVIILGTTYTMYVSLEATPMSNNFYNLVLMVGFVLMITFIVMMYYVMINMTRTGIELMNAKKGFAHDENPAYF